MGTANHDPQENAVFSDSSLYPWAWNTQHTFIEHLLCASSGAGNPAVGKMVSALFFLAQSPLQEGDKGQETCSLTQEDVR